MNLYGNLDIKWSAGYGGSPIHHIDNDTLVYGSGNLVTFMKSNGKVIRSIQSEGSGVGPVAVCPKANLFAYAECTIQPRIFILSYPTCKVEAVLEGGAQLEYSHLVFSSDGKKVASVSSVPDFTLSLWNCEECTVICDTKVGTSVSQISVNPLNWKQLCVVSSANVTLWNLEQCDDVNLLSPVKAVLPDIEAAVGYQSHPILPCSSNDAKLEHASQRLERRDTKLDGGLTLFTPTDISKVLYSESYNTFMQKRVLVEPKCHCWTPEQSVYVGCSGGQLLMMESDSGVTKLVANPQLTASSVPDEIHNTDILSKRERKVSITESEVALKTGHALLREGSVDCIALSRKGLFTAGKNGQINCFESSSSLKLLGTCSVNQPVVSLSWSFNYSQLVLGTAEGSVFCVDPNKLESGATTISSTGRSRLIGVDVITPGTTHCISCRRDGTLHVWSIENGQLVSTLELNTECTSIACLASSHTAMVGTSSGQLLLIALNELSEPRLVWKKFMHNGPVKAIRCDDAGKFMATMSDKGEVFFYDARASTGFQVIGYTGVRGDLVDISCCGELDERHVQFGVLSTTDGRSLITTLKLPIHVLNESPPELYSDATKQFSSKFVQVVEAFVSERISSLTLAPGDAAFSFLDSNFHLSKFKLSSEQGAVLSLQSSFEGHELKCGKPILSFHQEWMLSAGCDGKLLLRLVEKPEPAVVCTPHHYRSGGCIDAVFTRDGQYVLTAGDNTNLTCLKMVFKEQGKLKGATAIEYHQRCVRKLGEVCSRENQIVAELPVFSESEPKDEKSWLDMSKEEAHKTEDEKYAELKSQLREEINKLRERVLTMIASNADLPDIERLERQDFILDTEEHQQILAEEEKLIEGVKGEIEMVNLANMFLREQIKGECWDSMAVKGKTLKAFRNHIQVNNYPLKGRSEATKKETRRVETLRKIEIAEKKIRDEVGASLKQTLQSFRSDEVIEDDELVGEEKIEEEMGDPNSMLGSHGAQLGGESKLLCDQFHLHSPVMKKHQIVLLEDCIFRMKETFNKEFSDAFRAKENEIARIREKNIRISKIISQLKLNDSLIEPSLDIEEQPDRLLSVDDSEVTVEKYISPEELKRIEEAEKSEEARILAEMGDNPRDRALNMMMGGRLEANVEEDLFKDMAKPELMSKDPTELTEEEIIIVREFQKKEEAFLEERERLKKSLEAELNKLQTSIVQGMEQFDERVLKLFQLKIRTEMAIHQEELKVLRLSRALLVEFEITKRGRQLNQILEDKKVAKIQLSSLISNAKKKVEDYRDEYEQHQTEDREMDKGFKKDFADCEPYVDQLYKLFRKRPRGQKLKQVPSETGLVADPTSDNPFALRPSSAAKGGGRSGGWEEQMSKLDEVSHMPENLELSSWDRFVIYRHKKIESELKVKGVALKLAEINDFLQKRQAEDESIQQDIQQAFKELNKLQEDKMIFDMNLEIQFLLKQGQVEVDMDGFVPDFTDSVLVHRSRIEELNSQIRTLGESKLSSMTECKDFKRGINTLEWEHKKMRMEAEDLIEKAKDIQLLRVTKDLQQRLMEENVAAKDQNEIETLENTIELTQKMNRKSIRGCQKTLHKLQRKVDELHSTNTGLDRQLLEMEVSVAERQQIERLAGIAPSEANREQRMQDIVTRRRLVEAAKGHDQEISVLRTELERQRMRTFPALVQVD